MSTSVPPLRTFPIHVPPVPGEAIDSWLETIAFKHLSTFGSVLDQSGVRQRYSDEVHWRSDLLAPSVQILDAIAYVTDTPVEGVQATVLARSELGRPRFDRWGWRRCSRVCPQCLADTGGRWMLSWRHALTFACNIHQCLLVGTCEHCRRPWRESPCRVDLIPVPLHCANSLQPNGHRERCGADLAAALTYAVGYDHPVLQAQRQIDTVKRGDALPVLYDVARDSQSVLTDLAILSRWMLNAVDVSDLARICEVARGDTLPLAAYQLDRSITSASGTGIARPTPAQIALSATVALAVLDSASLGAAQNLLQRVMAYTRAEWSARLSRRMTCLGLSERVNAVYTAAYDGVFRNRARSSF